MKISKQLLFLSGGVAGGFIAGYLVSSYQMSDHFREQRKRVEGVISRFSQVLKESHVRIREINSRIKRELTHPIPDLYRATESLCLDEDELIL